MKTHRQIKAKYDELKILSASSDIYDSALGMLEWVLEDTSSCPLCAHPQRIQIESSVNNGTMTPAFLEQKNSWSVGTVIEHMNEHLEFDPIYAGAVEQMREQTINTLNTAEDLQQRMNVWLNEWEQKKDIEGISEEWLQTATRLASELNRGLKLIGVLKKEIGVDSQLLLAQQKVDSIMGILVNVLSDSPHLLDKIELQVAALKEPTYIQDANYEVIE